jgi:ketosteroid isomerase-like protein
MSRFPIAALAVATALAACSGTASAPGGHTSPASPSHTAELSPALAPIAWWLGDWVSDAGTSSEHWVAAGGAIYGIALHKQTFEVIVIDDGDGSGKPDGVLRLYAMLDGKRSTEFRQRTIGDGVATFARQADGVVKTITYRQAKDRSGFVETFEGDGASLEFPWQRLAPAPRAPAIEAADRAFADATAVRGGDGWAAAFDPQGGMMAGDDRVEHDALAAAMAPLLAKGKLTWAPIASGQVGALGYSVGKAAFTGADGTVAFRTSYVTIWRAQADGSWKVLFDTGRRIQPE